MAKDSRWGRGKVFLLVLLCASLLGNATLLVQWWSNNQQWETEMYGIASYAAAMQASADFANGVRRQYELSASGKSVYTHRNDGPFEVWEWSYYPMLGHGHEFANRRFVEMYNLKMRSMQSNPTSFNPHAMGATPTTQP